MNICVVGQGYVGLPITIHAAQAGYTVYGLDIDKEKIDELRKGRTTSPEVKKHDLLNLQSDGKINFISELNNDVSISIFVIAVPTPLNEIKKPNLSMLKNACEIIANFIQPNTLIINESTSFIGTLRDYIKPLIEVKSNSIGLKYAVAPERIDPGNLKWTLSNTPRVISGLSIEAIDEASEFYGKFCNQIHKVAIPEIAEASKLLENSFRQVNIALVNELSNIASKYKFSLNEAIKAAATKPFGYMPFYPGIGVGGHCIPVDPSYLAFSAESVGIEAKFINLAQQTNSLMPRIVAERIKSFFDGNLDGKRIQIAGITYKPNISDLRESPALDFIAELTSFGANISWHDPFIAEYNNQQSVELDPSIDLGLIVTPHDQINFSIWLEAGTKVFDLSANTINYGWPKFL
jgi:UDP-N-acetyl-D-glucosamine dehydrogenase